MGKAILGLVVVLALAGVAGAVPSGPSGTIYFSAYDFTGGQMRFYYLDVNSDWSKNGSVTGYATVSWDTTGNAGSSWPKSHGSYTDPPSNMLTVVPNATTGLQNETSLHSATLFQPVYYNTTAAGSVGTGAVRGVDYLGVNAGTNNVVVYNDGFDGSSNSTTGATTYPMAVGITPSYVNPNGESWGILGIGNYTRNTWTGTFTANGMQTVSSGTAEPYANNNAYGNAFGYCNANYSVDGTSVTGMLAIMNNQSASAGGGNGGYIGFMVTYKTATGWTTPVSVSAFGTGYNGGVIWSGFATNGGGNPGRYGWDFADVNGNGIPDFYYIGTTAYSGGTSVIGKAEDLSGNGKWNDGLNNSIYEESINTNIGWAGGTIMRLVQVAPADLDFPGGHWNLLVFRTGSTASVRVYGLLSDGTWDSTSTEIIVNSSDTSIFLPQANANSTSVSYSTNMVFVPLGAAQAEVPEPATMMLVGTGLLGLAGVLRRRLIS